MSRFDKTEQLRDVGDAETIKVQIPPTQRGGLLRGMKGQGLRSS